MAQSDKSEKKQSGCVTALLIVIGAGVVVVVLAGFAIYWFLSSESSAKFKDTIKDTVSFAKEATIGPGPDALRALGCKDVMITNVGRMIQITGAFLPEGTEVDVTPEALAEMVVTCTMPGPGAEAPDCATVAKRVGAAIQSPPEQMIVMVNAKREPGPVCRGYYTPDGRRLSGAGDSFEKTP